MYSTSFAELFSCLDCSIAINGCLLASARLEYLYDIWWRALTSVLEKKPHPSPSSPHLTCATMPASAQRDKWWLVHHAFTIPMLRYRYDCSIREICSAFVGIVDSRVWQASSLPMTWNARTNHALLVTSPAPSWSRKPFPSDTRLVSKITMLLITTKLLAHNLSNERANFYGAYLPTSIHDTHILTVPFHLPAIAWMRVRPGGPMASCPNYLQS